MAEPETVLLVDDDPETLDSLHYGIQDALGVNVVAVRSGPEALDVLRKHRVALIVSDYRMPGMDGIEFLKRSLVIAPDAIRVLLTAFPTQDVSGRAVHEARCAFLIAKPFDPRRFFDVVDGLLQKRRRERA